jgi:hypothetical protein
LSLRLTSGRTARPRVRGKVSEKIHGKVRVVAERLR